MMEWALLIIRYHRSAPEKGEGEWESEQHWIIIASLLLLIPFFSLADL